MCYKYTCALPGKTLNEITLVLPGIVNGCNYFLMLAKIWYFNQYLYV